MKITKKIVAKRLIKKAEFYEGVEGFTDSGMLSIYKNPTGREIDEARKESSEPNAIRGIITSDGTEYCWAGSILHSWVGKWSDFPVDGPDLYRFAFDNGEWLFDLNMDRTFKESLQLFTQYKDKLSRYGDMSADFVFWNGSDEGTDYEEFNDDDIVELDTEAIVSKSVDNVEKFLDRINEKGE